MNMENDSRTIAPMMFINVVVFLIASFVSTDVYLPSLPAIANAMQTTSSMVQLTLTIYLVGFSISQLVFGLLSDKYGRRPMILIGLSIYFAGSVLVVMANNIDMLILGRFIQGLGIGAASSLGRVVLRDVLESKHIARIFSYVAMIAIITPAVAPMLGGYIQHYFGYKGNLFFMLLYGAFVGIFTLLYLPETIAKKNSHAFKIKTLLKNALLVFFTPRVILNIICSGLAFSIIIVYSAINPFLLQNTLHVNAKNYGLLTLIIATGLVIGVFFNMRLLKYYGPSFLTIFGFIISIVAGGAMILMSKMTPSILNVVLLSMLAAMAPAFILPNASAQTFSVYPNITGFVGAIYGSLQILISSLFGFVLYLLQVQTQLGLGLLIGAIGVMGLITASGLL